jgi:hypothetical protein
MGIGAAMMVITEEAMAEVGATVWDKNNRRLVREFTQRWDEYEASAVEAGSNEKPLSKQERWALREVMTNPEIGAWRARLDGTNRRKLNHPNKVIERWRRGWCGSSAGSRAAQEAQGEAAESHHPHRRHRRHRDGR